MEKEGLMVLEEDQKVIMVKIAENINNEFPKLLAPMLISSPAKIQKISMRNVSGSSRHQQAWPLHPVPVQPQREGDQIYNLFVPGLK